MMKYMKNFRRIILLSLVSIFTVLSMSPPAMANEINYFYNGNDILLYDEKAQDPTICTAGSGKLVGTTNKEKTWNYLRAKGLTAEQAAGIAGNLAQESSFVPDAQEDSKPWPSGGWGIAQWTGTRRTNTSGTGIADAVQKASLPYTNENTPANLVENLLAFELDYMWNEAVKRGDIGALKADTEDLTEEAAVREATISWHNNYEISADVTPTARITWATKIYYELRSAPVPTSSSGGGCTASSFSTVDGFTYFSQYDPSWADTKYGTSTIELSGCGPTSMAMIISSLTKKVITPRQVADFGNKYYIPGAGSSHELFSASAENWGLNAGSINISETQVRDVLGKGGLIVAAGSGAYPYTTSGHILVIRAMTPEGKLLVANPLPLSGDQNKTSAQVVANTAWFNTEYSWSDLASKTTAMYAISN